MDPMPRASYLLSRTPGARALVSRVRSTLRVCLHEDSGPAAVDAGSKRAVGGGHLAVPVELGGASP
jgi:hypothetical protein